MRLKTVITLAKSVEPDQTFFFFFYKIARWETNSLFSKTNSRRPIHPSMNTIIHVPLWAQRQKTYLRTRAPSLIRILNGHILDSQGCKVSLSGQSWLLSDCAYAQADLSHLHLWAHMSEITFPNIAAPFTRCGSYVKRFMPQHFSCLSRLSRSQVSNWNSTATCLHQYNI